MEFYVSHIWPTWQTVVFVMNVDGLFSFWIEEIGLVFAWHISGSLHVYNYVWNCNCSIKIILAIFTNTSFFIFGIYKFLEDALRTIILIKTHGNRNFRFLCHFVWSEIIPLNARRELIERLSQTRHILLPCLLARQQVFYLGAWSGCLDATLSHSFPQIWKCPNIRGVGICHVLSFLADGQNWVRI